MIPSLSFHPAATGEKCYFLIELQQDQLDKRIKTAGAPGLRIDER